jgi:hypothetical protein
MGLIGQCLSQHERWRYSHFRQYEQFLEATSRDFLKYCRCMLLSRMFTPAILITEAYVPSSESEEVLSALYGKDVTPRPSQETGPAAFMSKREPQAWPNEGMLRPRKGFYKQTITEVAVNKEW